jgi:hypothetical protein
MASWASSQRAISSAAVFINLTFPAAGLSDSIERFRAGREKNLMKLDEIVSRMAARHRKGTRASECLSQE